MLSFTHMLRDPFARPATEAAPETSVESAKTKLAEKKIGLLEKLKASPYAFALTALMSINSQTGCTPFRELPPMAADVGKSQHEVHMRQDRCNIGRRQAKEIFKRTGRTPQIREYAAEAYLKFNACYEGLAHNVWDEKTYQEAELALAAAQKKY